MNTEQTPVKEDLTTESTTFDLDWAKCGGVWLLKGKGLQKDYFFVGYVEIENRIYMTNAANGDGESLLKKDLAHVRMATRAECDAAGVEYIEPPVSAEELAELRKDSERLWLLTELEDSVFDRIMSESESLEDLREALDVELLAMKCGA